MFRVLAAVMLLATACVKKERSPETPAETVSSTATTVVAGSDSVTSVKPHPDSNPAALPAANAKNSALTCVPAVLKPNDTLTLRMKVPHGDYLTANQPGGSLFFIVYPRFDDPSRKFSLIPSDEFRTIAKLQLPADLRAIPWHYGRDTTERFFSRPGKYVLWVGENLESDINRHAVKCEVLYQP